MLSAYDLAQMQATQVDAYPDRMTVYRIVRTDDGFGGTTTGAASVVQDDVPCRVTPAQTQMMGGQADRQLEIEKWTVRCPVDTDVIDDDVLVITTLGGEKLQVEDAKRPKSWETGRSLMCEKVRGAEFEVE